jgi:hypothetical protein
MPSPFPGMDPYLEGYLWMPTHGQMIAEVARQLAPKLRPRYLALMTERFVLEEPEGVSISTSSRYPDVGVVAVDSGETAPEGESVEPAPIRLTTVMPELVPHFTVEIRDVANRRLVTAIELLSPTNKRGEGREEYLAKRRRILLSTAHLLEIDLLRAGQRVPMRERIPEAHYFVFLSRADDRPATACWPISLREPLPTVPVPLLDEDPDVALDLQAALTNVYDLLGYDLAVDYGQDPEVPLTREETSWADSLLRAARLRQ